ncbi:hypothetical protein J7J08_03650 [Stenotrophomonas sp. ISL-67]|nr:hypothetical protein [Stenotrophomonas sp. ISL-67]
MVYSMAINALSRTCAIVISRRKPEKTAAEEQFAALPVLLTRELMVMRDAFHACLAALKEWRSRKLLATVALLHVGSLAAFVLLLLATGFVPLFSALFNGR